MGLIDDLKPGPVALDTQVFIYFIEETKQYLPLLKSLFEAIDQVSLPAATSGLTLMEVLVAHIGLAIFRLPIAMRRY